MRRICAIPVSGDIEQGSGWERLDVHFGLWYRKGSRFPEVAKRLLILHVDLLRGVIISAKRLVRFLRVYARHASTSSLMPWLVDGGRDARPAWHSRWIFPLLARQLERSISKIGISDDHEGGRWGRRTLRAHALSLNPGKRRWCDLLFGVACRLVHGARYLSESKPNMLPALTGYWYFLKFDNTLRFGSVTSRSYHLRGLVLRR